MKKTSANRLPRYLRAVVMNRGSRYQPSKQVEMIAEWQPDLAILDVGLPKTNGIDLAIALTRGHPACRVLLFSGQPSTTDLLADAAANGHLFEIMAKPVHPKVLLERAAAALSVNPKETMETLGDFN